MKGGQNINSVRKKPTYLEQIFKKCNKKQNTKPKIVIKTETRMAPVKQKNNWMVEKERKRAAFPIGGISVKLKYNKCHYSKPSCESTSEQTEMLAMGSVLKKSFKAIPLTEKAKQNLIQQNLLRAVKEAEKEYCVEEINKIIYNEESHKVALFKDYLILDDIKEFLRKVYSRAEFLSRIQKFAKHSEEFNKPTYPILEERLILEKGLERKEKVQGIKEDDAQHKEPGSTFMHTEFLDGLAQEDLENSKSILPSVSLLNRVPENKEKFQDLLERLEKEDEAVVVVPKPFVTERNIKMSGVKTNRTAFYTPVAQMSLTKDKLELIESYFKKSKKPLVNVTARATPTTQITKNIILHSTRNFTEVKKKPLVEIPKSSVGTYNKTHKVLSASKPLLNIKKIVLHSNTQLSRNYFASNSPHLNHVQSHLAKAIQTITSPSQQTSKKPVPLHLGIQKTSQALRTLQSSKSPLLANRLTPKSDFHKTKLFRVRQALSSANSLRSYQ